MSYFKFSFARWLLIIGAVSVIGLLPTWVVKADEGDGPRPLAKLAPGVETRIPMARSDEETSDSHPFIDFLRPDLEWTPQDKDVPKSVTLYSKATETMFRRGVWQYQFSFKPLRMIRIDLPQPDGTMQRRLVWYMVYRVTNPGQHLTPVEGPPPEGAVRSDKAVWHPGYYTVEKVDRPEQMLANLAPHRFSPIFKLESLDPHVKDKEWIDQTIPLAKDAIYKKERPPCKLSEFYNTTEIGAREIPVSSGRIDNSLWGYVTWMGGDPVKPAPRDIDPHIKLFRINLWGLTNAYKWRDPPGAFKPGDPPGTGRQFASKVLSIYFYRPGDVYLQHEDEIRLGIPGRKVDWDWSYR